MKSKVIYILISCWICLTAIPFNANAQTDSLILTAKQRIAHHKEMEEKAPFKERIALKVNTIDWAILIANVGMEFNLGSSVKNRYTLGANVKYSGGANVSFNPKYDFKLLDARLELRRYWKPKLTVTSGKRKSPKFWRTYYWGIYAGYADYTIQIPNGFEGQGFSLGGSWGCETALLKFKHGCLDLDLGFSIGAMMNKYDKTKMVEEERILVKSQDWEILHYPVVSEIRVGLVYRFKSIRDKNFKRKH